MIETTIVQISTSIFNIALKSYFKNQNSCKNGGINDGINILQGMLFRKMFL